MLVIIWTIMALNSRCNVFCFSLFFCLLAIASAQLSSDFYATSCSSALSTIKSKVKSAVSKERRMGASLLRLHFHDCFVNASSFFSLSLPSFVSFILLLTYTCIYSLRSCMNIHAYVYTTSTWHDMISKHPWTLSWNRIYVACMSFQKLHIYFSTPWRTHCVFVD